MSIHRVASRLPLLALLLSNAVWAAQLPDSAAIYGIESCGSGSAPCNASNFFVLGGGSLPPAYLFSLQADGTGFTVLGAITAGAGEIDADGLAMRSNRTLFAFELSETVSEQGNALVSEVTGSRLISLGSGNPVGAPVGATLSGRDIRGAAFDVRDNLWVLDSANNEVLGIDPATGDVIAGTARALTLAGSGFDLQTMTDLAFGADGTALVSNLAQFFVLDLTSGALTPRFDDPSTGHAGLAFDPALPASLLTYDVTAFDDIYSYDTGLVTPIRNTVLLDFIPSNNAGRGDLASVTVPIPAAAPAFVLVLLSLGTWRRRMLAHVVG